MLVSDSNSTFNIQLDLENNFACVTSVYFKRVVREMPPWIEVYLTTDRYFAVCHPQKFKAIRQRKYINPICLIIFLILCILSIENFWYFIDKYVKAASQGVSTSQLGFKTYINVSNNFNISKCTSNEINAFFSDLISVALRVIIPGLLMSIFSFLIVRTVLKSKRRINVNNSIPHHIGNKRSRENSFTKTVIYMNIIFLLLNIPVTIMMILINFYFNNYNILIDAIIGNVFLITYDISNLYYSFRFSLNLIFNKIFQDEFLMMLGLGYRKISHFLIKTNDKAT